MPLYEYQCDACERRFEVIQKFSDPPADSCRVCGRGPVRRLLSSPAIQFKGSGWYITDYAQKGKSGESAGDSAGSKDTAAGSKTESSAPDSSKAAAAAPASGAKSDAST
jgi:putative FmdB family regulatory protein